MKKYKAIFFDWDGTAVMSRKAPVDEAIEVMRPLLEAGVKLAIVSGTTYEKIAGGHIEQYFTTEQLNNLYLGLGRGAYNYSFKDGKPYIFSDRIPDINTLEAIHRICFEIHMELKKAYDFDTDIVFTRPNYCKIDLMVHNDRGDNLFMQESELDCLKKSLSDHGIKDGLQGLLKMSLRIGRKYGVEVKPTCDAKYLEVGISSKSDNADTILCHIMEDSQLTAEDCAFWGDEFVGIEKGIFGSDSFMYTPTTSAGDFFDISNVPGERPEGVCVLGGGVDCFLKFLRTQAQ